jgi:STE24 endopeptidase
MNTTTTRGPEGASHPDAGTSDQHPDHEVQTSGSTHAKLGIAEALATACALVMCVVARVPHRLLEATGIQGWALRLVVVVAVVSGARGLARAPFTFVRSSSGRQWAATEIKTVVATLVVGTTLTLPLYALVRATSAWWLYAAVLFGAVSVIGQLTMPFSLRLQAGPLVPAPPELAGRVRAIAIRAGVDAGTVLVAGTSANKKDASACNAYVVGLGPTRRIVLDGALADWPPDLVDQVVAHEIGHWRLGHASRRLPLAVAAQLGTLAVAALLLSWEPLLSWAGVSIAGDPRSFPLLLLVTPLVALPARCLLSWRDRWQERSADQFALDLLHAPTSFATMLDRAAAEGGAPRALPWWRRLTASHPPIDERTLACTRFASTA